MLVHYFVRKPGTFGEVIYPSELADDLPYSGVGAFFLTGERADDIADSYIFYGIREGQILALSLERQGRTSTFIANVPEVGTFRFFAKATNPVPRYTGTFPIAGPREAVRQLSTNDHVDLDTAVRTRDFYFVGFTPMIDAATTHGPPSSPLDLR